MILFNVFIFSILSGYVIFFYAAPPPTNHLSFSHTPQHQDKLLFAFGPLPDRVWVLDKKVSSNFWFLVFNSVSTDKFTDSAIAMNSKVNGEHKEKVLQRWEGGDSNSDDYDLESDMVHNTLYSSTA